ncbi:PD-(D/E)XK nuclease family protein [Kocuria arenosa]|uniref:PD-(D/E)XK nuclease family protein n=1 Tax=Kocuria arenosa TaxID=3071446 RepID=UPI0034D60691
MTKSLWVSEMAEAGRGYFDMEDFTSIVLADLDMPELPVSKPTDPSTLEGAAVSVAERHRDAFLAEAGFEHTPGIELDCSNVVIGGVPSGGFVDRVTQIGTAPDGSPRLLVEDYKSGKLPRKGEATVHDQLRIYVLMIEELTGIRPVAARGDLHPLREVHRRRRRRPGPRRGPGAP